MYLAHNPDEYHDRYLEIIQELQGLEPRMTPFIKKINDQIIAGSGSVL